MESVAELRRAVHEFDAVTAEVDDGQPEASGGKALSQLDAAGAARRHDVRDQGVDRKGRAVPFLEGGRGGFEFRHLVALLLERFADEASKRRLVFHEDDAAPMRRAWPRDSAVPP